MIAIDRNPVVIRGEAPTEIWWRGKQWAVTEAGIEALDGTYFIDKARLLEDWKNWPWLRQLSDKNWVDSDDFATAFMVGLVLHGYSQADAATLKHHLSKMARASE